MKIAIFNDIKIGKFLLKQKSDTYNDYFYFFYHLHKNSSLSRKMEC